MVQHGSLASRGSGDRRSPEQRSLFKELRDRYSPEVFIFNAIYVNIILHNFCTLWYVTQVYIIITREFFRALLLIILSYIFRYAVFKDYVERIEIGDENLEQFTTAYKHFGIHIQDDNSVVAREWAPGAQEVFLTGDFSKRKSYLYVWLYV